MDRVNRPYKIGMLNLSENCYFFSLLIGTKRSLLAYNKMRRVMEGTCNSSCLPNGGGGGGGTLALGFTKDVRTQWVKF